MNIFKTYHPLVIFIYFTSIIIFSVICMHPIYIVISFIFSSIYLISLNGRFIKYVIPLILTISVFYPAYNHEGLTTLTYLPDNNPLTMESVVYGVALAFSLTATLMWFLCSIKVLTSDKLMCIFATLHPSISLMTSITLQFVPRFTYHMKKTFYAHRGIGLDGEKVNIFKKIKLWMSVFSITVTWAAENCINISDSMKSRGYGFFKRSSFSLYRYKKTDILATVTVILLIIHIVVTPTNFQYFPHISFNSVKISHIIIYSVFCSFPLLVEISEKIKKWV